MLFNLLKNLWLYFSTYWKDSGYGFQLVENILAMVFNLLKKFWLCFSTCWKIYGYAFQPVEKNLAMLFNFWKVIFYEFQVSEKFSWMVFRAWKVQKSLTVSLVWWACMPTDHLGLEGKRLQLQLRSPLGKVLAGASSSQDWSMLRLSSQFIHRLTLHAVASVK